MNEDWFGAPLERLREIAPIAIANARWIASHPAEALRELEAKLIFESMDCPLGDGPAPTKLDDASFPWFRFGVESSMKRTEFRIAGYRCRESGRVGRFVEFLASGKSLGKIVLDDDRDYRDTDAELRPLILWAEYLVGLGDTALATAAGAPPPKFPEPKRGLSKKAAAVREILMDAWPELRSGRELVAALDQRGLDETPAHLSDRIFPELKEAGCPVENLGRGYYLVPTYFSAQLGIERERGGIAAVSTATSAGETLAGMKNPSFRPVTLSQAARALGLPAAWLREEADAGRIPCLIAGDRYLFDLDLLREIVMERTRRGDGPPSKKEVER